MTSHDDERQHVRPGQTAGPISPANRNPWYVLATSHGEQKSGSFDTALHERNRKIWHRFYLGTPVEDDRLRLAQLHAVDAEEFQVLNANDIAHLSTAFSERGLEFQERVLRDEIGFEGLSFPDGAFFDGFVFAAPVRFDGSTFGSVCSFSRAYFQKSASFRKAEFADAANFSQALFDDPAVFVDSRFEASASFPLAVFRQRANLERSYFAGTVDFQQADFNDGVYFSEGVFAERVNLLQVTFSEKASFRDCFFERPLNLRGAVFETHYPNLEGVVLHANSIFSSDRRSWPSLPKNSAEEGKNTCAVIRHVLASQSRVDDAHFFFRREMWFAERIGDWFFTFPVKFYRVSSDYGFSLWRPCAGLGATILLGWYIFVFSLVWNTSGEAPFDGVWNALALSIANTFPFFGFNRLYFSAEFLQLLHPALRLVSAAQSVLGVIFIFFFGLGLRNRFRLK